MFVATFYSFKGGVGRTMALMNVACELSKKKKVLIVDFDLEAPGASTFPSCRVSQGKSGLVEYFIEYRSTNKAPFAKDYIYKCDALTFVRGTGGENLGAIEGVTGELYIMPAGNMLSAYGSNFGQVDFVDLYEKRHGYLLLEDLKAQWKSLGFDYVLVDSRTGHTDSSGICTRQLPDAVVAVFSPNEQNLLGLRAVVGEIRADAIQADVARQLIFVASRVPQLDDEHGQLEKMLNRFEVALEYDTDNFSEIHNYDSLALVDQEVFVCTRPRTRLASEYRSLATMLAARNLGDEEGALAYLDVAKRQELAEIQVDDSRKLDRIGETHKSSAEIMYRVAVIRYQRRELESAIAAIDAAYVAEDAKDDGFTKGKANILGLRVRIYRAANQPAEARNAAHRCLKLREAPRLVLIDAIRTILELDPDHLPEPENVRVFEGTPLNILTATANAMTFSRLSAQYGAKLLKFAFGRYRKEGSVTASQDFNAVLQLIAGGLFEDALEVLRELAPREENGTSLVYLFNHAMAEWGLVGEPNLRLFESARLRFESSSSKELSRHSDANVSQCMAVVYGLLGEREKARDSLADALKKVRFGLTTFSCWSYLPANRATFERDCSMIKGLIDDQSVVPPFISENAAIVRH